MTGEDLLCSPPDQCKPEHSPNVHRGYILFWPESSPWHFLQSRSRLCRKKGNQRWCQTARHNEPADDGKVYPYTAEAHQAPYKDDHHLPFHMQSQGGHPRQSFYTKTRQSAIPKKGRKSGPKQECKPSQTMVYLHDRQADALGKTRQSQACSTKGGQDIRPRSDAI